MESKKASFFKRVSDLQHELKSPKNMYNSFAKFSYRSAESILESVKPLNSKYGVTLFLKDEVVQVGERYYIKAVATLLDSEDPDNQMVVTAFSREAAEQRGQSESQVTGTASSYARKYALNGLYLIDDTKDADIDEFTNQANKPTQTKASAVTAKQVGLIKTKAMEFGKLRNRSADDVYKVLKINDVEKLTQIQANAAIQQLDTWLAGLKKG